MRIADLTAPTVTKFTRTLLALLIALAATTGLAQEGQRRQGPPSGQRQEQTAPAAPGQSVLRLLPADSVTEHAIDIPSGHLAYTATAGTLSLIDQSGERSAAMFYTAYVAKGAEPSRRPVTFVFNGGPGAASAYLHLGLVGPRILDFSAANRDPSAARLEDNPNTWLAFTDLVMLDPVGTGWSRAAKPDGA